MERYAVAVLSVESVVDLWRKQDRAEHSREENSRLEVESPQRDFGGNTGQSQRRIPPRRETGWNTKEIVAGGDPPERASPETRCGVQSSCATSSVRLTL